MNKKLLDSDYQSILGDLPDETPHSFFNTAIIDRVVVPFIYNQEVRNWVRKMHSNVKKYAPTLWKITQREDAMVSREQFIDSNGDKLNTYRVRLNKKVPAQFHIVALHGNGSCALEILNNILESVQSLNDSDTVEVISFDYCGSVASPGLYQGIDHLFEQVIDQVEKLIDDGVTAEKICLYGHSLGGLVGVLAAARLAKKGVNINLFSDRSPNSVDSVLTEIVPVTKWVPNLFRTKIVLSRYQHDAAESYLTLLPERRACMASSSDEVIPLPATLAGVLKDKHNQDEGKIIDRLKHSWALSSQNNDYFVEFCNSVISNISLKNTK